MGQIPPRQEDDYEIHIVATNTASSWHTASDRDTGDSSNSHILRMPAGLDENGKPSRDAGGYRLWSLGPTTRASETLRDSNPGHPEGHDTGYMHSRLSQPMGNILGFTTVHQIGSDGTYSFAQPIRHESLPQEQRQLLNRLIMHSTLSHSPEVNGNIFDPLTHGQAFKKLRGFLGQIVNPQPEL